MIRIFSLTGFVFFLFQSLILLCAIPVFSENSFCVIPRLSNSSNIRSDIVICLCPFALSKIRFLTYNLIVAYWHKFVNAI